MIDSSRLRPSLLICLLLTGLTALTFWPVVHNGFVNFDDPFYVTQNPYVLGGLSFQNIAWAFKTSYFGNWHPLTWLSHMLDVEMFGLNPGYHHLTSLVIHICNTCLLFFVLNQATKKLWSSAIVAALFAVHPLHVESVAWISERKDVLSTFFALLSLLAYIRYTEKKPESKGATLTFGLSVLFFALGLMSKAMVVTLPFVMLLLDFWPLKRPAKFEMEILKVQGSKFRVQGLLPFFQEKVPFFALTFFFTVFSSRVLAAASTTYSTPSTPNLIANAFVSYLRYLGKTFWPIHLSAFYPRTAALPLTEVAASVAAIVILSLLAIYLARRRPYTFVGWFWFVGTLVPVIALPFGDHAMADRYTYFPLIGIFIALVWAAADLEIQSHGFPPALASSILAGAAVVLIALCALVSSRQVKYWRTSKDLLEHVLAVSGDSAMAHNNLAALLMVERDWPAAEKHLTAALRLQPSFPAPRVNLARVLAQEGKPNEAAQELNYLNPAWKAEGHRQLGEVFLSQMKTNEAAEQYTFAVQLAPSNAPTRETLGLLLAQQGKVAEASDQFVALVQLRPDARSHYHLALSLLIQDKVEEAINHYQEAIRLGPDWPEPLNDLAWLLATSPRAVLRNGARAVELAERACHLTQFKEARFLGTLDAAYAEAGRFPEAITTAEQAKNLAVAAGDKTIADLAEERLKLYRAGLPYHQP